MAKIHNREAILLSFIFVLILANISHADVGFVLLNQTIDKPLNSGLFINVPAQVINQGQCPVDCSYSRSSFEGDNYTVRIPTRINPGVSLDISINVMVPTCPSNQSCRIPVSVACIESGCSGNEFTNESYILFTNVGVQSSGGQNQSVVTTNNLKPIQNSALPFAVVPQMKEIRAGARGKEFEHRTNNK